MAKDSFPDQSLLKRALHYAHLAPSVHNTQPWSFKITKGAVCFYIAHERVLVHGDPTKRELWLSLGACIENFAQACEALGIVIDKERYDFHPADNEPFATLELSTNKPGADSRDLLEIIRKRHTDRRRYLSEEPNLATIQQIATAGTRGSVKTVVSTDEDMKKTAAALIEQGLTMALGSPEFRRELHELVHHSWADVEVGMPGYVLNRSGPGSIAEKLTLRLGQGIRKRARKEAAHFRSSPALLLVTSRGDVPSYWLEAGRAFEAALLKATELGLSQATNAAAVEAADFHEDIERMLDTDWRLQAVARLGYTKSPLRKQSPRLTLDKVLH